MSFYGYDALQAGAQKVQAMQNIQGSVSSGMQNMAQAGSEIESAVIADKKEKVETAKLAEKDKLALTGAIRSRDIIVNLVREAQKVDPSVGDQFGGGDVMEKMPTIQEIKAEPDKWSKYLETMSETLAIGIAKSGKVKLDAIDKLIGLQGWSEKALATLNKAGAGAAVGMATAPGMEQMNAANVAKPEGVMAASGFKPSYARSAPSTRDEALATVGRIAPQYAGEGDTISKDVRMQALPTKASIVDDEIALLNANAKGQNTAQDNSLDWLKFWQDNSKEESDQYLKTKDDYVQQQGKVTDLIKSTAEVEGDLATAKQLERDANSDDIMVSTSAQEQLQKLGSSKDLGVKLKMQKAELDEVKRARNRTEKTMQKMEETAKSQYVKQSAAARKQEKKDAEDAANREADNLLQKRALNGKTFDEQYKNGGTNGAYPMLQSYAVETGVSEDILNRAIQKLETRRVSSAEGPIQKPKTVAAVAVPETISKKQPESLDEIFGDM